MALNLQKVAELQRATTALRTSLELSTAISRTQNALQALKGLDLTGARVLRRSAPIKFAKNMPATAPGEASFAIGGDDHLALARDFEARRKAGTLKLGRKRA